MKYSRCAATWRASIRLPGGAAFTHLTDVKSLSIHSPGLGLFIVEKMAEGHGGTIDVRSTEEAGTTFTMRLPKSDGRE